MSACWRCGPDTMPLSAPQPACGRPRASLPLPAAPIPLRGRRVAGQGANIPGIYLDGPWTAATAIAASGQGMIATGRVWTGRTLQGRWQTTAVRIESAGQPRPAATATPLAGGSLRARLLPAAIALRNHGGRGPNSRSRPIGPAPGPPTSDRRASTERARAENRDKPGTKRRPRTGKTPGQNGCAARDLNPEPAD